MPGLGAAATVGVAGTAGVGVGVCVVEGEAVAGAAVATNNVRDVATTGSFTVCLNNISRVVDVGLSGRVITTPGTC